MHSIEAIETKIIKSYSTDVIERNADLIVLLKILII